MVDRIEKRSMMFSGGDVRCYATTFCAVENARFEDQKWMDAQDDRREWQM